jgi:hypothetical protein
MKIEIAPLTHEPRNDPVEGAVLVPPGTHIVPQARLSGAKGPEILTRDRKHVMEKLDGHSTYRLIPHRDVQENSRIHRTSEKRRKIEEIA